MAAQLPKPQLNALPLGAHSVSALTDEALFDACGVRIAFTGREGGVSTGPYASLNTGDHVEDDLACVARNREIVLEALGFQGAPLVVPKQVHGTSVVKVPAAGDAPQAMEEAAAGADAVVVEAPEVAALLNFADCLPLIIVAPSGRFAVVHAGWRGALAGIAGKAARELAQVEGEGSAAGFNAYIGPHIRSECFETSEDIAAQFADAYGAELLADARHVSLAQAVSTDLARAGLTRERIADAGICTVCNSDRYFSYRAADGVCGRHAAIAIRRAN
ncbi:MAG: laccase domain-containing protein [Eggerthellaceae bacterium]|nr:laccase domain-containing protein [Eggerthellaceae bacterium]